MVTWRSKKHNVFARRNAKAEFRFVAHGFCKVLGVIRLLEEFKVCTLKPIKAYCDNNIAIFIAHDLVLHDKIKHVEVDKHFIKEKIDSGVICMSYIPTTT